MIFGAIRGYIEEGGTATSALRSYREAGYGVTTQTWYRRYGEVSRAVAAAGELAAHPGATTLDPGQYTPWSAGREGAYAHQVRIMGHDTAFGIDIEHEWTVMSARPLSPDEATQYAIDEFEANTGEGTSGEGQAVVGAVLVGAYRLVGR